MKIIKRVTVILILTEMTANPAAAVAQNKNSQLSSLKVNKSSVTIARLSYP